jgi:thioredoxin
MINLTDENFQKAINEPFKLVLVYFWMEGCLPCLLLSPILEKLSFEFKDEIVFMKANIKETEKTAERYGIYAFPTVLLFKEGKMVSGFMGLKSEDEIKNWLNEIIENEKIEKTIKELETYAQNSGFKLNEDKKIVRAIVKGLLENEKKYQKRYCPCRRLKEDEEENEKMVCPCFWHKEEIERDGHCLCNLFVKGS